MNTPLDRPVTVPKVVQGCLTLRILTVNQVFERLGRRYTGPFQ